MNEYICTGCGNSVEGEEKPEKCPHCDAGPDKLKLIENEKIEVKEEVKSSGSTVLGIRGTPSEMTQLLNMVLLPISGNKTFYKKTHHRIRRIFFVLFYTVKNFTIHCHNYIEPQSFVCYHTPL